VGQEPGAGVASVFYTGAYGLGHQFFTLLYISIVVLWTASVFTRVVQKKVRRTVLYTGVILLGWIIVRLIKYQLPLGSVMNIFLWYFYYFFQLSLPLVLLYLAWAVDKPEDKVFLPKWLSCFFIVNGILIMLVLTNNLHGMVFRIDMANPNWNTEYTYGFIYFLVQAGCYVPLVAGIIILLWKGQQRLRMQGVILFIGLFGLMAVFTIGYVMRIPIAWGSDYTIVVGLFVMMLFEASIRSGMIPVNSKYVALFTNSPLKLQIRNSAGMFILSSASVDKYDNDEVMRAVTSYPFPVLRDENTLLFAKQIIGGYALWQEDISSLNRLHKETEESVAKLKAANVILAKEEKIKRAAQEENAKTQLMAQLESEINGHTIKLSAMIEQIENVTDQPKAMARITLLLCYLKRRCNLLFSENEAGALQAGELTAHFEELAEIAGFSDVRAIITSGVKTRVPVRCATLLYDFFYNIIHWAARAGRQRILVHLGMENESIVLRIITSEDVRSFHMEKSLVNAIVSAGGTYEVKNLDDAFSISLIFPEGGEGNA